MIAARSIGLLVLWCSACGLLASPKTDLSSTNQQTRDAAAKILRATFIPPPRTNWDSVIASLKAGMSTTNILQSLRPVIVRPEGRGGTGNFNADRFRLDDVWILECYFNGDTFYGCKLLPLILEVWVEPPRNFNGLWTTYLVNGQKSREFHYKNGKLDGGITSFYDDGSRAVLTHFVEGIQEGEETGYFRSGKVYYRGFYKTNAIVAARF
jgi:hypothetical protein